MKQMLNQNITQKPIFKPKKLFSTEEKSSTDDFVPEYFSWMEAMPRCMSEV